MNQDSKQLDSTERQALDDRLGMIGVLQELTVSALGLFDPLQPLDDFMHDVAARLGCRVALCLEANVGQPPCLSLLASAGLSPSSRAQKIDLFDQERLEEIVFPYAELASPGLKRWIVRPPEETTSADRNWWFDLHFETEPRLAHRYHGLMERIAHYFGVALVHRRLYKLSLENERALRVSNSKLESLVDSIQSGIIAEDDRGRITHVNKAFCHMFGLTPQPDELIGSNCSQTKKAIKELFAAPIHIVFCSDEIKAAGAVVIGESLRLKDGRILERDYVPIHLEARQIGHVWTYRDVTRAHKSAEEIRRLNAELELRVQERTRQLARANEDLERSLMRLQDTQNQLVQAGKLAAVGQLAAGLSHELNNPLGIILGFAQGLERRVSATDPLHLPVASIVRESLRCKSLVQELLTFSRTAKKSVEDIDPNVLLRGGFQLLRLRAGAQHTQLNLEVDDSVPMIQANATQIQQVIVNLGTNALDAVEKEGEVDLRSRCGEHKGEVVIEVTDTGPGMSEEVRSRIFEPFFTTKEVGKGTGLGLSLVYEIIQQHGGRIDVESSLGIGTRFCVYLPSVGAPSLPANKSGVPADATGGE